MATAQLNAYKREKRIETKMLTRQSLFIKEYVQVKYPDIYKEAATMYNEINQHYSMKPDLRKTVEFKLWKNSIAAINNQPQTPVPPQKPYIYKRTTYKSIPVDTAINTTTGHQPQSESSKKQTDGRVTGREMCLNIQLITPPVAHKTTQPPEGISTTQETVIHPPEGISTTQETVIQEGDRTEYIDPIIRDELSPQNMEEDIDPTIIDEISPEIMENIITELRADPQLKNMMDNIEKNVEREETVEEELIGLMIDMPELYDPLEEESMFW